MEGVVAESLSIGQGGCDNGEALEPAAIGDEEDI